MTNFIPRILLLFAWRVEPRAHVKLVDWPGSPCCIVGQKTP